MLIFYAILTCAMIVVILNDTTRYLIPNWLVLGLVLLYPVAVYIAHMQPDWKMACLIALGVFIAGYILFILQLLGGGDVKLLAATALYAGKESIVDYIVWVTIFGGALALLLLALRPSAQYVLNKLKKTEALPRVLTPGERYFPYGVAIAAAFLMLLWGGKFPGLVL